MCLLLIGEAWAPLSLSHCHAANVLAGLASTRRYGAVKMSAMGGHKHQLHPGTRVSRRPVIQQDYWLRLQQQVFSLVQASPRLYFHTHVHPIIGREGLASIREEE